MDLPEMVREMVREEVKAQLPGAVAAALQVFKPEKGDQGDPGQPGETPSIAHLETRVQNLVNEVESKVSVQLAALNLLGEK